ncbi:sigma-70 family RNA polymerase sigma factor [Trinickia sp.]|uniref:sigma-70 family RNA polymerase sigma factor n=1 Tax=Trinickia sp. TaxID=2571163 RepID=UPI003F7F61F1
MPQWMTEDGELEAEELTAWMTQMRPRLHRYCARIVGSAFEGEDVVQEALMHALQAWPVAGEIRQPQAWLMRIAHNAALDALRQKKRRGWLEPEAAVDDLPDEIAAADTRVAAAANLAHFMHLTTIERAAVVLADVFGYSLVETGELLDMSVAAVKSALHRGRTRLKAVARMPVKPRPAMNEADRERLEAYVERFNARDFDALRNLLSEEVRLDLVGRAQYAGRKGVSQYFGRYEANTACRLALGYAEDRIVLLASDRAIGNDVGYVIELGWGGDRLVAIRDFRYGMYVMEGLEVRRG